MEIKGLQKGTTVMYDSMEFYEKPQIKVLDMSCIQSPNPEWKKHLKPEPNNVFSKDQKEKQS